MKMRRSTVVTLLVAVLLLGIVLTACNSATPTPTPTPEPTPVPTATPVPAHDQAMGNPGMGGHGPGQGAGGPRGRGADTGMRDRHMAPVPEEYAGLTSPVPADEASLQRGEEIYTTYCASCHGDGGMGDGPAGTALNPPPAPIAHTSQMLGDDYLFWRISEGGIPFDTAMPSYKDILDEQARWDVINYIRALGSGQVQPRQAVGGAMFDPQAEAQKHADMLAQAVEQGVITQEEADLFAAVHDKLDQYRQQHMEELRNQAGTGADMLDTMLSALVEQGTITQEEADAFKAIHQRLVDAGLMQ